MAKTHSLLINYCAFNILFVSIWKVGSVNAPQVFNCRSWSDRRPSSRIYTYYDLTARRQVSTLPKLRLALNKHAFTHTEIDYYGSLILSTSVRRKTCEVCGIIFMCMTSHAIYLGITMSQSTNNYLNAINWFLIFCGDMACAFYSENGSNFHISIMLLVRCTLALNSIDTNRTSLINKSSGNLTLC